MRNSFYLITFLFAVMLLPVFNACRKEVAPKDESDNFFALSTIKDENVKEFAIEIKRQNEQFHFLSDFVKTNGYILWNDAQKLSISKDEILVVLPLVLPNRQEINGFIIGKKKQGNKFIFGLYRKDLLLNYGFELSDSNPNANQVQTVINYFNLKKFGIDKYKLIDDRQIPNSILQNHAGNINKSKLVAKYRFNSGSLAGRLDAVECITYYEETEWWYCPLGDGGDGPCSGGWYDHSTYDPVQFCYESYFEPDGGGGGTFWWTPGSGGGNIPVADPCADAQPGANRATTLSQNNTYITSKNSIQAAASDGFEHSITFGKDANGNITASSITTGGPSGGNVNSNWTNAFADIHNHPSNQPPSPGDLYYLVSLNQNHSSWDTRFVITSDGSVYALLVVNLSKATNFVNNHGSVTIGSNPPDFPDPLFSDFDDARLFFEMQGDSQVIAEEKAMALILDKYDSRWHC